MNVVKQQVNRESLKDKVITYSGTRYNPFTHEEVMETIDEFLDKKGLSVKNELYLQAGAGQKAIGRLAIDTGNPKFTYELSWKNSLDGSMSFGVASGIHTFICSNGTVYGDLSSYRRKHTGKSKYDIVNTLEQTVNEIDKAIKLHSDRINQMREISLTKKAIAQLCGEMYINEGIIKSDQLSILKREIKTPQFDYECKDTLAELYENTTFAIKESSPLFWHNNHIQVSNFFKNQFSLV